MAVLFLLLAFLIVVVLAAAGLENTDSSTATLFNMSLDARRQHLDNRSFDQLTDGQLLVLAAALGFLVALFLFLAFGASRTRRSRRRELRSRRRDAESRVDELERENARLQKELTGVREELETTERSRADAVTERDRAEATADRVRTAADPTRTPGTVTAPGLDTMSCGVWERPAAVCGVAACNPGFANCDQFNGNGCEVNVLSDHNNCGSCGHA